MIVRRRFFSGDLRSIVCRVGLCIAAVLSVSVFSLPSVGQQEGDEREVSGVQELRARLRRVVDAPSDDRFLEEYWRLLHEMGVMPNIWMGNTCPLAHGYTLRVDKDDPSIWAVDDTAGKEQDVVKKYAFVVIRKDGITPIRLEEGDALLLRDGTRAVLISLDPLRYTPLGSRFSTKSRAER